MDKYKLEYEMKKKGISVEELCSKTGISKTSFYRKINGITEFRLCEIKRIAELLELTDLSSIFFTDKVS